MEPSDSPSVSTNCPPALTSCLLIGIFAIAEVLAYAEEVKRWESHSDQAELKIKGFGFTWKEFVGQKWNALRSALIGTGTRYPARHRGLHRRYSLLDDRQKDLQAPGEVRHWDHGRRGGLRDLQQRSHRRRLIPLLTLGIPGDGVTAMLLGAFMIHGLTPGPLLFVESADLIYTIFIACILANVVMLVLELGGMRIFVRLLSIPKYILLPVVLVLCTVGAFATNNRIFDAQSIVIFGVLGYLMSKFKIPVAPFILSFILCDLLETNLRRGLMLTQNDFLAFFTHPIAAVFMVAAVLFVVWTVSQAGAQPQKGDCGCGLSPLRSKSIFTKEDFPMKKRLLALITGAALVGTLLAGCGSTSENTESPDAAGNTGSASGGGWPSGPVSIVVPASAGGGTDLLARVLAEKLTAKLGQSFVVVNVTAPAAPAASTRFMRPPQTATPSSSSTMPC